MVAKIPAEKVEELFCNQLFKISSEIRQMFAKTAMPEQSRKPISMLGYTIGKLDNLESIIGEVAKLAQRHVKCGATPQQYHPVDAALSWTLEKGPDTNWS